MAVLAFYLQSPPGSSFAVIKKTVLVSIVQGSVADISSAINANISSVQQLIADTPQPKTTTNTTTFPRTVSNSEKKSDKKLYIIAGVVGGVLLLVIIGGILGWCCMMKNR